jgi:hypothetical protein
MTKSDNYLNIGLSSIIITPPQPVWLHGYATKERERSFEGKVHDLYANSVAFEDPAGKILLLITLDICVMRKNEAKKFMTVLTAETGIPEERIILNLSHTHSGPMINCDDAERYPLSAEMLKRIFDYTEFLTKRISESAKQAIADLKPGLLFWRKGEVSFVRNRRLFDADGKYSTMGPNPEGYCDSGVTVLKVTKPDGTLRGVIFSLSCHAVTLGPDNIKLCGDYPGFTKQYLIEKYPEIVPLFVQGCGADANTEPRNTVDQMDLVKRQGRELFDQVDKVITGKMTPLQGSIMAAKKDMMLPLRQRTKKQLEIEVNGREGFSHNPKRILEMLDRGEAQPSMYSAPLAVWKFGDDLTLVALPGETVGEYMPLIRSIIPSEKLWFAGYCNDVFGYLPTSRIIEEGGYEDRGLIYEVGQFAEEAEEIVLESVKELYGKISI